MASVIWNKRASKQLQELQEYLEQEFGINVVKTFTGKLFKFLDLLVKYPHIGTLENKTEDIRGFLLHRHTIPLSFIKLNKILFTYYPCLITDKILIKRKLKELLCPTTVKSIKTLFSCGSLVIILTLW